MSRVRIADLKAHLSARLREVRGGRTLTVLDRDIPIARIVPFAESTALEIRRATRRPAGLRRPRRPARRTDSLALLLADRSSR